MSEYQILFAIVAAAIFLLLVGLRALWVLRCASISCAYYLRLHYSPAMPPFWIMMLRIWEWDPVTVTRHPAYTNRQT